MISREIESKLSEVFLSISAQENEIELFRYELSSHRDFDPISVFRSLDKSNTNSLSHNEIKDLLEKYNFYCVKSETNSLIKHYDSNKNDCLTYSEFLQLILPCTNQKLCELALTKRGACNSDLEFLIAKLIQQEILYHRSLESLRKDLVSKFGFNLLDCFKAINFKGDSSLTRHALSEFLRKFKIITEQDIDAIFRRLDNDRDSVLSYSEFVDAIMPANRGELASFSGNVRSSCPLRLSPKRDLHKKCSSPPRDSGFYYLNNIEQSSPKRHASPLRKSPIKQEYKDVTRVASYQSAVPAHSPFSDQALKHSPEEFSNFSYPANFALRSVSSQKFDTNGFNYLQSNKTKESVNKRSSPLRCTKKKSSSNGLEVLPNPAGSLAELRELVIMMQEEIKGHTLIDGIRNNLALKHDFNLIDAFRMFDLNDNGFITLMDIEQCLSRIGIRPSHDEIYMLIRHYSRLQDSRIRFSDLSEMLTPKQDEYARIMRNKQALNIPGLDRFRVFARDTLNVLANAFKALLEAEIYAEKQRQKIRRLPGFNLYQVFNSIDKDKNGFVTINEFQNMMGSFGSAVSSKDLIVIMQKFDKNYDGKVSYSEFIDELTPKSSQLY